MLNFLAKVAPRMLISVMLIKPEGHAFQKGSPQCTAKKSF